MQKSIDYSWNGRVRPQNVKEKAEIFERVGDKGDMGFREKTKDIKNEGERWVGRLEGQKGSMLSRRVADRFLRQENWKLYLRVNEKVFSAPPEYDNSCACMY